MKVSELVDRLRAFDPEAEVHLQFTSREFASPGWVGIMDTADWLDEERNFQLVISPWEPEDYRKPETDE
ncbi:MAG: hypothetical protein ABSE96_22395 [Terracidiphilus sp.]|jgi:hypothetical protein